MNLINFFLIFSNVRVINLGVKVLIGFTVVSKLPGGPFILKLTPKTPSPTFFPTNISPINGIDEIVLLIVVAGTNVPLKLINFFSFEYNLPLKWILQGRLHTISSNSH